MNTVFVVCVALYGALILIEAVKLGLELVDLCEYEPKTKSALILTVAAMLLGCLLSFCGVWVWNTAMGVLAQDALTTTQWFSLVGFGLIFSGYLLDEYNTHKIEQQVKQEVAEELKALQELD